MRGDYPGDGTRLAVVPGSVLVCAGVCWMDWCVSVCAGVPHLTCLGGYFLCLLACIGSFCTTGVGTSTGMAECLVSVGWFHASSCFLYFTKVMAFFSNSPPNDNSARNCKTVLQIFTSLSKFITMLYTISEKLNYLKHL